MLSMCLLFCFVIFWMLCYVMCERKINVDNKKKLFILLTKYISSERSDSQDSIFGGLFVIGVILTEKFRHL